MTSIGADKQGMDAVNRSSLSRLDLSLQSYSDDCSIYWYMHIYTTALMDLLDCVYELKL